MDDNLHPLVNYVVMPLFAFANASISFEHFTLADIEGVTLSVFIALVRANCSASSHLHGWP